MRFRVTVFSALVLTAAAIISVALAPLGGQTPAAGTGVPRMADGKPDLSGIWQVLDNAIDGNVEPHDASYGVRAGQGVIVDPADGLIPYLPAARAKRQENYKNRAKDPVSLCYSPGVPRLMYVPFPFQITQAPQNIMVTSEFVNNFRNIYVNGSTHLEGIDFYMGDSRAKWEGDTLVVDVANFRDEPDGIPTWFDASGNYHSDKLHVVERWTRNSRDTMTYRATMDDSKVFSRPWTIEVLLYRHQEKNFRLLDYQCQIFKEKLVRQGAGPAFKIVERD